MGSRPWPTGACNTFIAVSLTDGIDENGQPKVVTNWSGLCYYTDTSNTTFASDGQKSGMASVIMIEGDIAPNLQHLEGFVQLNGDASVNYKIKIGYRPRYLSGEVAYTRLELM